MEVGMGLEVGVEVGKEAGVGMGVEVGMEVGDGTDGTASSKAHLARGGSQGTRVCLSIRNMVPETGRRCTWLLHLRRRRYPNLNLANTVLTLAPPLARILTRGALQQQQHLTLICHTAARLPLRLHLASVVETITDKR